MNTAIGACMETGMAGYIVIITGRTLQWRTACKSENYIHGGEIGLSFDTLHSKGAARTRT